MSVQDPPQRYFSLHYMLLRFLGLGWWHHPDENDTRNFPGLYLYYTIFTEAVWEVGFIGLETIGPFIDEAVKDRFMFSLSFVVTHNLTLIKICIFLFRNKEIQDIVRTLNIDLHQFYQNNNTNLKTIKLTRILTATFVFFGWLTVANSDIYGILQDIRWKSEVMKLNSTAPKPARILPQTIYIPWNYDTEKSYILTFLLETVGILWTGHILLIIDTFIGSLILHMSSQFSILQEAFTTAYDRTMENLIQNVNQNREEDIIINVNDKDENYERIVEMYYSKDEIDAALEKTLLHCFRQHQMLIRCVEKFAVTYSYGFMTQLLSSLAAICVVMVQLSKDASSFKSMRLATSIAFFAAIITQLALQCLTGNELTFQASRVAEAVMSCKWERMSPRLRRSLLMPMMRAQRPLRLTAGGFTNMDNACFVAIIKAAYSYYAVISEKQT